MKYFNSHTPCGVRPDEKYESLIVLLSLLSAALCCTCPSTANSRPHKYVGLVFFVSKDNVISSFCPICRNWRLMQALMMPILVGLSLIWGIFSSSLSIRTRRIVCARRVCGYGEPLMTACSSFVMSDGSMVSLVLLGEISSFFYLPQCNRFRTGKGLKIDLMLHDIIHNFPELLTMYETNRSSWRIRFETRNITLHIREEIWNYIEPHIRQKCK